MNNRRLARATSLQLWAMRLQLVGLIAPFVIGAVVILGVVVIVIAN